MDSSLKVDDKTPVTELPLGSIPGDLLFVYGITAPAMGEEAPRYDLNWTQYSGEEYDGNLVCDGLRIRADLLRVSMVEEIFAVVREHPSSRVFFAVKKGPDPIRAVDARKSARAISREMRDRIVRGDVEPRDVYIGLDLLGSLKE